MIALYELFGPRERVAGIVRLRSSFLAFSPSAVRFVLKLMVEHFSPSKSTTSLGLHLRT